MKTIASNEAKVGKHEIERGMTEQLRGLKGISSYHSHVKAKRANAKPHEQAFWDMKETAYRNAAVKH